MADGNPPGASRADAVRQLGLWLAANIGVEPMAAADVPAPFTDGWHFALSVASEQLALRILLEEDFPHSEPRIGFAVPPAFPSYPHVEPDGLICVLTANDLINPDDPVGVTRHVLGGAADILEQGLSGANVDDFRREFATYWRPVAHEKSILSLLDPSGPSRPVAIWPGQTRTIVAENETALRAWMQNRVGKNKSLPRSRAHEGLLIWLDRPLLPSEYPASPEALHAIAVAAGAGDTFDKAIARSHGQLVILLGADTGDGTCFAGITLRGTARGQRRGRQKGFRPGKQPPALARIAAMAGEVRWSPVGRADAWWIHGRDANPDISDLQMARVGLIGCGSLGSPVARLLGQAGVGTICLVDPESLDWENISRHALGAASMHGNKAEELAADLGRAFPHGRFIGHPQRWQRCVAALSKCDLVISTIGNSADENLLNLLRLSDGGPPTIYGWSEPHGVAGHAVVIGPGAGCFRCGLDGLGEARGRVSEWSGSTLRRVPACGAHFQPYGAAAIMSVAAMVTDLTLDVLLGRAVSGDHRIVAAPRTVVEAAGGTWSAAWAATAGADDAGGRMRNFRWMPDPGCSACHGEGLK